MCSTALLLLLLLAITPIVAFQFLCAEMSCTITKWAPNEEGTFVLTHVPENTAILKFINLYQHSFNLGILNALVDCCISVEIEKSPIHRIVLPASTNVSYLKLDRTHLKDVYFEKVNGLVEYLSISVSQLKSVPPTVAHLTALKRLEIIQSPIEAVNLNLFAKLQHLEHLSLCRNKILFLRVSVDSGDDFSNLKEIYLSNNRLTTVSLHSFNGMQALDTLDFQRNRIRRVEGPFASRSLKFLDLGENRIDTMYLCEWNVSKLSSFAMNNNGLSSLPTCLELAMPNVVYLGFHSNALENSNVWNVISMKKLKLLDFSYNKLTSAVFGAVTFSLGTLNLSHNRITRLSVPVAGKGLRINVSYNLLEQFDLKTLSANVTVLDMQCNPIDCSFDTALMRRGEKMQCTVNDEIVTKACNSTAGVD